MSRKIDGLYEALAAVLNALEAEGDNPGAVIGNIHGIQGTSGRVRWDWKEDEWIAEETY